MWPFKHHHNPQLERAKAERAESRRRAREARFLAAQIARIQVENHFAENIIQGLTEGHRRGGHE